MLYTTTRSDLESFASGIAMQEAAAENGGMYVPAELQPLTKDELSELLGKSSAGILAEIMNLFFDCDLSEKDIQFLLGKELARLTRMSHRITMAECWRNADGDFSRIQRILAVRIGSGAVGEWLHVAVRIAMMFVLYAQMIREGIIETGAKFDVALVSGDFSGPMAAWYARYMGIPVDTVVCCCNENGAPWDLLSQGSLKTDVQVKHTAVPKCDIARPRGLERLIYAALGLKEAQRYVECCEKGRRFELIEPDHEQLSGGMYACVSSDQRLPHVIANTYATNGYVLCPYSALAYSGLMDYRAATGNSAPALIVCEYSPLQSEDVVAEVLGISASRLHEKLGVVI